jgi:hypothetical protein
MRVLQKEMTLMRHRMLFLVATLGIMAVTQTTPIFSQDRPKEWTVIDLNTLDCRTLLKMQAEAKDATLAFYRHSGLLLEI